jgi:cytochrome c oxidase cbb3-type subunit III
MSGRHGPRGRAGRGALAAVAGAASVLIALTLGGRAQVDQAETREPGADLLAGGGGAASELLQVPVVTLYPGGVSPAPQMESPVADDPGAAQRGMRYFVQMNCVGCHAPNGAGGMGPSLSNAQFIYGSAPENIYLSILQGRPQGMPAWGGMLPDEVIWDLVAYIQSISKEPDAPWGKTISPGGFTIEQVPAEFTTTAEPWRYTTPFSYGQAPFEQPKGAPRESPSQ